MYQYNAYCLNFSSEIPLPECCVSDGGEPDFVIVTKHLTPPQLEATNIHRRGIMAQTAVDTDGSLWLHWEGVVTFRACEGKLLEVHNFTDEAAVLSLFTVSEAIGLILFQRNHFLLHASSVKVGSAAWLFMGTPGAGKSTTCAGFVKAGCSLLGDDLTAITFDEQGHPFVSPAYPQLKIWEKSAVGLGYHTDELSPVSEGINKFALAPRYNFAPEPVPLTRMYFIHNDEQLPAFRAMHPSELPSETLRHFPLPNQLLSPLVLQQLFRQSLSCASTADAFLLKRPDGFEALETWVRDSLSSE